MIDVSEARADTPGVGNRIHFNNCGAGLMPRPVLDAVRNHLQTEYEIGGYEAEAGARKTIEGTYDALAALLNCSRDEIAVVENATRAWDMVFYSLEFREGDTILTARSEYASNYIAYLQLAKKTGVRIEVVADDGDGQVDVEALGRRIDGSVKLISVTHVPTNGGLVHPAAEIGAVAAEHGIPFLLDACQSAGQIPIDVESMHIDFLSATSRKYLRGPRGAGFLYVKKSRIENLEPPFLDLHAAEWTSESGYRIRPDARRFENWESSIANKIGLGAAVNYALGWGIGEINLRVSGLAARLRGLLDGIPGVGVRDLGKTKCGIVSFTSEKMPPGEIVRRLRERNVNVSESPAKYTYLDMHGRGIGALVRAGVHYYNTEEEIDAFVRELTDILAGP